MIACREVGKSYGQQRVLDGVSFRVEPGERVALLGLNGAGKTTLLRCLLGLSSFRGEILLDGRPPSDPAARLGLTYVPQRAPRFDLSVDEFIAAFARLRGCEAEAVRRRAGFLGLDLGRHGKKRLDDLSGGMLQKAVTACALGCGAPTLLLDEPAANLDARSRAELLGALGEAAGDRTVLVSSHRLEDVGLLAERAVVLEGGRATFDGPLSEMPLRDRTLLFGGAPPPQESPPPRASPPAPAEGAAGTREPAAPAPPAVSGSTAGGAGLLRWELRNAVRSPWFFASAGVFLAGGLAVILFGTTSTLLGSRGFSRSLATLAHLGLFVVPLLALLPGAGAIAGDREAGNLSFLLAQPLPRAKLYRSRWAGLAAAAALALLGTFGAIGFVAALRGVSTQLVLGLLGLTLLLSSAFVSVGLCVSTALRTRARATAAGLAVWLILVALGSLGVMTAFVRWGLPAPVLEAWALLNPVEAYRLTALHLLGAGPDLAGPLGVALESTLGPAGLSVAGPASLFLWTVGAYVAGLRLFQCTEA